MDNNLLPLSFDVWSVGTLQLGVVIARFVGMYLLHSTLLLASVWLLLRVIRLESYYVQERMWKFAAVAGLASAALQVSTGLGIPVSLQFGESSQTNITLSSNVPVADTASTAQDLENTLALVQSSLDELNVDLEGTFTDVEVADDGDLPQVNVDEPEANVAADSPVIPTPMIEEKPLATTVISATVSDSVDSPSLAWQHGVLLAVSGWLGLWTVVLGLQSLKFRWRMRQVAEAAPSHRQLLESICRSRNIKRKVRLFNCNQFEEPVAFGVFRWTILLPAQVEPRLNRDELTALLSHELAHLKRGDIYWLICGRLLTSWFAIQPLNFIARRRWQEHAEFQCDDWAVNSESDRLTLARSLTMVAEWQASRQVCAGVVSASGQRFHITDRVERLVADAKPDRWMQRPQQIAVTGTGLIAVVALVVFSPRINDAAEFETSVEWPLGEPVEVYAPYEAVPIEPVTSHEDEASLDELLEAVSGLHTDIRLLLDDLETLEPMLNQLAKDPNVAAKAARLRQRVKEITSSSDSVTNQSSDEVIIEDLNY